MTVNHPIPHRLFAKRGIFLILFSLLFLYLTVRGDDFWPEAKYDPQVPTPESVLGFPPGERPARYSEVVTYLKTLAEESPLVKIEAFGETFEGRKLYLLFISSEENLARLEEIRDNLARLSDPRQPLSQREKQALLESTPAVAWMSYGIHGDELSSTDAALRLAYQLAAGQDSSTRKIRREVLTIIDPMQNPDGRERFLAMMQQWNGKVPNGDVQSLQHTGMWPRGRGNHYLFDMNRDWFILANPESRARVKAMLKWNPQVVVDSHEMGPLDTYLFNPPREPINPHVQQRTRHWWQVFTQDQAAAFDRFGWSYYTRAWYEGWYPGYTSWIEFLGGIQILYEQASTQGSFVSRPDGTRLSFREAVHHHFISSMANLLTTANHRQALLEDYYRVRLAAIQPPKKEKNKTYYLVPGANPTRAWRLVKKLRQVGIEVEQAEKAFRVNGLIDYWDKTPRSRELPAGTFLIRTNQPARFLIEAIMEFDPRLKTEFLQEERKSLEKNKRTRMYEVSAWSFPMAYGLETYYSLEMPRVRTHPVKEIPTPEGKVVNSRARYGFAFDGRDDAALQALVCLFRKGYHVRLARKPFTSEGIRFSRGSFLLRKVENRSDLEKDLQTISQRTGVTFYGLNSALVQEGPDLGGREFVLLKEPRIGLVTGPSISTTSFSALWYLLDVELRYPYYSLLNVYDLGNLDLRKYNVLILPSTWGGHEVYGKILGKEGKKKLQSWVKNGGTLIAIGNGAAFAADSSSGLSQVRLRRQVLKALKFYQQALFLEEQTGRTRIDSVQFWADRARPLRLPAQKKGEKPDLQQLKLLDARQRLFKPQGAILRVDLDEEHWLSAGVGSRVPVILYTSYAYMAKEPVQTVGRLADGSHLRLSGLLWPEARERWAKTAYLTREGLGNGQVILFAGEPNFRSYFYGSGRLLLNALLLGPGAGTCQPIPW